MRRLTRTAAGCASLALMCIASAASPLPPPPTQIELPADARSESIANALIVNGQPTSITRFEVSSTADAVVRHFRSQFGAGVVEPTLPGFRTIASRVGETFYTIRLRERDAGIVEGFVMTTPLAKPTPRDASAARADALSAALPVQSSVVSRVESNDGDLQSTVTIAVNAHSVSTNAEHLKRRLIEQGFALERDNAVQVERRDGRALWFTSAAGQVLVTIGDAGAYRSLVVNRLSRPQ